MVSESLVEVLSSSDSHEISKSNDVKKIKNIYDHIVKNKQNSKKLYKNLIKKIKDKH